MERLLDRSAEPLGELFVVVVMMTLPWPFSLIAITRSSGLKPRARIQTIVSSQSSTWYIPFVCLGIALYYLFISNLLLGFAFVLASALFMAGLYYIAILLNQLFGLYEPPAIKVQASGEYKAKTGVLSKFGFTSVEAALIRKDIRSFTRRRELIGGFIVPIVLHDCSHLQLYEHLKSRCPRRSQSHV